MGDDETRDSGRGGVTVTDVESLTPTQRFARAIERRDALIRDGEQRDAAAREREKRRRIMSSGPAE